MSARLGDLGENPSKKLEDVEGLSLGIVRTGGAGRALAPLCCSGAYTSARRSHSAPARTAQRDNPLCTRRSRSARHYGPRAPGRRA